MGNCSCSIYIAEQVFRTRDRVHGFQWNFSRLFSQSPACCRCRSIRGVCVRQDEPRRGNLGVARKLCGVSHVFYVIIISDTLVDHFILQCSLSLSVLWERRTILDPRIYIWRKLFNFWINVCRHCLFFRAIKFNESQQRSLYPSVSKVEWLQIYHFLSRHPHRTFRERFLSKTSSKQVY